MRKFQMIAFAVFAAMAVFAFATSSAFAVSKVLVEGNPVEAELSSEAVGLIELIKLDEDDGTVLDKIECSAIFDGTIEGGGVNGRFEDLLNLEKTLTVGTLVGTDNEKTPLSCKVTFDAGALTDCKENTTALVWLVNLNLQLEQRWNTEVQLVGGVYLTVILARNNLNEVKGYEAECESLIGIKGTEECTGGEVTSTLTNDSETSPPSILSEGKFEEGKVPEGELASCTLTGAGSGTINEVFDVWALGSSNQHITTALSE